MIKFSLNIIVKSLEDIKSFIDRINYDIDDYNYLEILLFDYTSDDRFISYFNKHYGNCSHLKYCDGRGLSINSIYNIGLDSSKGEYINFSTSSVEFPNDLLYRLETYLEDRSVVSLCLNNTNIVPSLIYGDIVFDNNDTFIQPLLDGYFIKRDIIGFTRFDESISIFESKTRFILDILLKTGNYYIVKDLKFNDDLDALFNDRYYYIDILRDFVLKYLVNIKNTYDMVPLFIQEYIFNMLFSKYKYNINNCVLNKKDENSFKQLVKKCLVYIDDNVIIKYNSEYRWLIIYLYSIKNKNMKLDIIDNNILVDGKEYSDFRDEVFNITEISRNKDYLHIEGYSSLDEVFDMLNIYLYSNGNFYDSDSKKKYSFKVFNKVLDKNYYEFDIPINDIDNIEFCINKDLDYVLNIDFKGIASRLNKRLDSFYKIDDGIIYYKKRKLFFTKNRFSVIIKYVFLYINIFNLYYFILYKLFRGKSVLFNLYEYGVNDNKVYCLNENNIKNNGYKLLRYNSYKSKIYLLTSKSIYCSGKDEVYKYLDFNNSYVKYKFLNDVIIVLDF